MLEGYIAQLFFNVKSYETNGWHWETHLFRKVVISHGSVHVPAQLALGWKIGLLFCHYVLLILGVSIRAHRVLDTSMFVYRVLH